MVTMVTISPLGIDTPECPECGEWEGASEGLLDSVRRHSNCVKALRAIQLAIHKSDEGSEVQRRIVEIADEVIGPIDPSDYE